MPKEHQTIGIKALPDSIRNSAILTVENLMQLAELPAIPLIQPFFKDNNLTNIIQYYSINPQEMEKELHLYAIKLLENGRVQEAWQVLLVQAY